MSDIPPSQDRSQDYERFVRLLTVHEPDVRAFLRALLPSWDAVDEVAQEASLIAWQKFSESTHEESFGGWLLTIARFEALKHRRKAARSRLMFTEELWGMLATEAGEAARNDRLAERRKHLSRCLQKLEASNRELLMRIYSSSITIKEIAKQLNRREQALYKTVQRLRASLFDCMTKAMAAEDA